MLKIRMQRTGRINTPSYRIIVTEHTSSPKAGTFVERVGTYDPKSKKRELNEERIKYWMSVGAKPSATVHNMLVGLGLLKGKKINVLPAYKEHASPEASQGGPEKSAEESAPASPAAAEAPAAEEKPVESTGEASKAE